MRTRIVLLILCAVVFSFSCRDHDDNLSLSSEKELLSFSFSRDLNRAAHLGQNITADVGSDEISVLIPDSVDKTHLIASFDFKGAAVLVHSVTQESGVTSNDFTEPVTYVIRAEDGSIKEYLVKVLSVPKRDTDYGIPHVYVYTDGQAPINSEEDYVHGYLVIDGNGDFDDYQGAMEIRGRGNTSWHFPKKPYKIKLEDKASLFGLQAHKKWILLANWRIGNLLGNAIPYKMAGFVGNAVYQSHDSCRCDAEWEIYRIL